MERHECSVVAVKDNSSTEGKGWKQRPPPWVMDLARGIKVNYPTKLLYLVVFSRGGWWGSTFFTLDPALFGTFVAVGAYPSFIANGGDKDRQVIAARALIDHPKPNTWIASSVDEFFLKNRAKPFTMKSEAQSEIRPASWSWRRTSAITICTTPSFTARIPQRAICFDWRFKDWRRREVCELVAAAGFQQAVMACAGDV